MTNGVPKPAGSATKEALALLVERQDLTGDQMRAMMDEIMSGTPAPVLTSAALTALRMKGETVTEITAAAQSMRSHGTHMAPPVDASGHSRELIEIVGTGGDGANTFNISTTTCFVVAAAGVPVAKHGNRSASSRSGAADCIEALGGALSLSPESNQQMLNDTNMCFFFAQRYHAAMKNVGPIRATLGMRTVFNILGPLTNPAAATRQVLGVYDPALVRPLSEVLNNLGVHHNLVVYSHDGMDELSSTSDNTVCECRNGEFREYTINPEQFGMRRGTKAELVGGEPADNAAITRRILGGDAGVETCRNTVVLNAAAALYIADVAPSWESAVQQAENVIDSGAAARTMEAFVAGTQRLSAHEAPANADQQTTTQAPA